MSTPDVSLFEFRWNEQLYQEPPLESVNSAQATTKMNNIVQNHPEVKIFTFQVYPTDEALRCMDAFKKTHAPKIPANFDVVHSRHDLPAHIKKGSDYDDPALWHSGLVNVYISRINQ